MNSLACLARKISGLDCKGSLHNVHSMTVFGKFCLKSLPGEKVTRSKLEPHFDEYPNPPCR